MSVLARGLLRWSTVDYMQPAFVLGKSCPTPPARSSSPGMTGRVQCVHPMLG